MTGGDGKDLYSDLIQWASSFRGPHLRRQICTVVSKSSLQTLIQDTCPNRGICIFPFVESMYMCVSDLQTNSSSRVNVFGGGKPLQMAELANCC